ncbi:DUF4232 domain-containing protein [Actinoplanes bogorensis]|uniref:DUF4232 domain-containing protein n=1 Tax=Paractinoplanes bogorensis TaxID=1610840 RepID=A0ABS5YPI9_9ACTN|nr:DUF4232 domain-containing protein [Actinoplanes bogorensis]MBU2665236.1 DUF4232 domain-containing protein [Actinoplanes bogorensis]
MTRRAWPALAALVLAGCSPPLSYADGATRSDPSPTASASSAAPACPLLELGTVNAAMSLAAQGLYLTNCSGTPYTLDGYPEIRALSARGEPLDVTMIRGTGSIAPGMPGHDRAPEPIVLQPGERAQTAVVWRNTYDDVRKSPVTATRLEVAPQPGRPAVVLTPEAGLDLGSTGSFAVSPWRAVPHAAASATSRVRPAPRISR